VPRAWRLASRERALSFDERERRIIEQALEQPGGNRVNAARILGITWDKRRHAIKKHNLR